MSIFTAKQKAYIDNAIAAVKALATGGGGSGSLARTTVSLTTATLADQAVETGTVALGKSFKLLTIAATAPCRVRLYRSAAYRSADAYRAIGTDPTGEHGVISDDNLVAGNLALDLPGFVFGDNMESTPTADIPFAVQNLSGSLAALTITFTRIVLEA